MLCLKDGDTCEKEIAELTGTTIGVVVGNVLTVGLLDLPGFEDVFDYDECPILDDPSLSIF